MYSLMLKTGPLECGNREDSITNGTISPTNLTRISFDTILESGF